MSAPNAPDLVELSDKWRAECGRGGQGHGHGRQDIFDGCGRGALAARGLLRQLPASPAPTVGGLAYAISGAEVGVFCAQLRINIFVLCVGAVTVGAAFGHAWGAARHGACATAKAFFLAHAGREMLGQTEVQSAQ